MEPRERASTLSDNVLCDAIDSAYSRSALCESMECEEESTDPFLLADVEEHVDC